MNRMSGSKDMKKELRRRESVLHTTGLGVIAFGLWTFLKGNMYFLLGGNRYADIAGIDPDIDPRLVLVIFYCVLLLVTALILLIHIGIGKGAISDARGVCVRGGYIRAAFVMILVYAGFVAADISVVGDRAEYLADEIVSTVVDLTIAVLMTDLFLSAIRVRKLRRTLPKEAGEE